MSSSTGPYHEADFFLKAIKLVDASVITDTTCHICQEEFGFDDSSENDPQDDSTLLKALPFGGPYGHDLPVHSAVSLTECSHIFGSECIAQWLLDNENTSCPLCRKQVIYRDTSGFDTWINDDFEFQDLHAPPPDPTPSPEDILAQAREQEHRQRRAVVESQSIEDLLNFDLDSEDDKAYSIIPTDHDIVLYVCLVMFTQVLTDPYRELLHRHLQDMTVTNDPDIAWFA